MNSRNDKQEELIRRLEDIRRQRTTIQTERTETNDNQGMRRNEQAGESTRQNRNKQRRPSSRPRTQTKNARGERKNTPHAPSARQSSQSSQTKNIHNQRRNMPHAPSDRRDPGQHSLETYSIGHYKDEIADSRYIAQTKISDKIKADDLTNQKVKSIKNNANPLLHQLSDKKNLRQAIILNEVLSKPIALRRHSR